MTDLKRTDMLNALDEAMGCFTQHWLHWRWDSLIINRRKPFTYRIFRQLDDGLRLSLHRFDPCDKEESFYHPHPWPGAFCVLQGSYLMGVGRSADRTSKPEPVLDIVLERFSRYEIIDPLTWHSVTPLVPAYTIMVNAEPWPADVAHTEVRTTKGKDLDTMGHEEVNSEIVRFRNLVVDYFASRDRRDL